MVEDNKAEILRRIVSLLPRANCGHCGYGNCGGFALAVYEERTSPFRCVVHPKAGYEISKVLGLEIPDEWKEEYTGQTLVSTGTGRERVGISGTGHHGHGHHDGHHSHNLVHGGDGERHHHSGRHLAHRHSP